MLDFFWTDLIVHSVRNPLKITRHAKRQEKITHNEGKNTNPSINHDPDLTQLPESSEKVTETVVKIVIQK